MSLAKAGKEVKRKSHSGLDPESREEETITLDVGLKSADMTKKMEEEMVHHK